MTDDHGIEQPAGEGRRSFLKKVGIGTAVAWTAPTVISRPALAQGTCNITGPTDLTGLAAWFDGADPTTINSFGPPPVADVAVQQWDDKSGNGRTFEQLTGANQPTWLFNTGINGLGSLSFDGVDDFMQWAAADAALAAMNAVTLILVIRNDVSPDGPVLWGLDSTNPGVTSAWQVGGADAPGTVTGETFSLASGGLAAGTTGAEYTLGTNLLTIQEAGGGFAMWVDTLATTLTAAGSVAATTDLTPSVANADTLRLGADDLGVPSFFDGMVAEVVLYDRILSGTELLDVECYLGLKWFV